MTPTRQGSFRLFKFAGVNVYLHWSWFAVAAFMITRRTEGYSSLVWNGLEYIALFLIVLIHEFGHALACRQVGGRADQIVLWPLGGVAYVDPPQRPGAMLWSIAAGPLVNVALLPILTFVGVACQALDFGPFLPVGEANQALVLSQPLSDTQELIQTIWIINLALLIFNLLPVYPLDGGQILRSLLWFVMGRARSLMVASIIGLVGVTALIGLAIWAQDIWIAIISGFIIMNCLGGLAQAKALLLAARLPRRGDFACPDCHAHPPIGALWLCGQCRQPFDTFGTRAICPNCGVQYDVTRCPDCGQSHPLAAWGASASVPPELPWRRIEG